MNKNRQIHVTLIALIMLLAASLFLAVQEEVTTLFRIAYIFVLLGVTDFWLGNVYLIYKAEFQPWIAAFPATVRLYLISQVAFSAVVVTLERVSLYRLHALWFVLIHIIIALFFAIRLIRLK